MDFTTLLDAPSGPTSRIQIARLGPVKDPRYGEFEITKDNVANWKRNLSKLPGGRSLIDFEHRSERAPRNSEAAGWITSIELDGDRVMADAEWTDKGAEAIKQKRYLFLSPAYGTYTDETGTSYEDTLCSTALTNKPVLGSMPMLSLASAERVSEAIDEDPALRFHMRALDGEHGEHIRALVMLDISAQDRRQAASEGHALPDGSYPIRNAAELHAAAVLAASGHGDVKAAKALIRRRAKDLGVDLDSLPGMGGESGDSRRAMDQALLTALDLPADADASAVLEAVTALKATPEPAAEPTKTLEQQAAETGRVLLDAEQVKTLQQQAAAGAAAQKQLHEQAFEHAFDKALEDRKVTPAEKDGLKHFYTLDAEATLSMLAAREPIVPEKPQGAPVIELSVDSSDEDIARAGLDPNDHRVHQMIKNKMLEQGLSEEHYPRLLSQYMTEGRI